MKPLIIFDSSIWVEIFFKGSKYKRCQRYFETHKLVGIPTTTVFEVYKKVLTQTSEEEALKVISYFKTFSILEVTLEVSLTAADISIQHQLAMADSMMLSHARLSGAVLLTLDNDFAGMDDAVVLR